MRGGDPERISLEIEPEPSDPERAALEQALAPPSTETGAADRSAWWRVGVRENTETAAGDRPPV